MVKYFATLLFLLIGSGAVLADAKQDCQKLSGDAAIRACDQAIHRNPRDSVSCYNRGLAYRQTGDLYRAIADHTKAIEIDPKFAAAYNNRGLAYRQTGDLDRAFADHTKAIEIDPKYAAAYNNRGNIFFDKGELERAIADYTKAIEIDPKYAAAYYNRGQAWAEKGNKDSAIADYTKAIEIDPKHAAAYYSRCWVRAKANRDLPLALADCDSAVRLRPNDDDTIDSRGFVYLRLNRVDEAIADYDAVLKINPENPYSLYGRGLAKKKKEDQAGRDADIAAAKAIKVDIVDEFAKWGVK